MNKLIQQQAWNASRRTGVPQEEMAGVGHLAAMKAIQCYDPEKGMNLTSWVWRCAQQAMFNFGRKQDLSPAEWFDPDLLPSKHSEWQPDKASIFKSTLDALSNEARWVVELVLTGSLPRTCRTPRKARGHLRKYMLKRMDLTHARVWEVFAEIKEALK